MQPALRVTSQGRDEVPQLCKLVTTDRVLLPPHVALLQVLCQVTVQGKGYLHPDSKVAASRLRLDRLLEYVPKGPSERVVSVHYSSIIDSSGGLSECSS